MGLNEPGAVSPFATVRELYAMQDRVLGELKAMEARLTDKIEQANRSHERTHEDMRASALERHRRIDAFIEDVEDREQFDLGRKDGERTIVTRILVVVRLLNEFRWLWIPIVAAALIAAGGIHIDFTAH